MITTISSSITNFSFYKSPVPLIIGNLPFKDNYKTSLHEWEYLDIYVVPKLQNVLYYDHFYKKYKINVKTTDISRYMYPGFCSPGYSTANYVLNPFTNDVNGVCPFMYYNAEAVSKIYYNSKINKW